MKEAFLKQNQEIENEIISDKLRNVKTKKPTCLKKMGNRDKGKTKCSLSQYIYF